MTRKQIYPLPGDRADEIAREIGMAYGSAAGAERAIAAALRAYGDERVQAFRQRVMHGDHPPIETLYSDMTAEEQERALADRVFAAAPPTETQERT